MSNKIFTQPLSFRVVIKFTLPTIIMLVIQQAFSMIDGIFVSNLIGTEALTALNLITPYFSIVYAISALFSSGGSAVVMIKMGEGKKKEAREDFTVLVLLNILVGIILTVFGFIFFKDLTSAFGSTAIVEAYCNSYLFTYVIFIIPALLFSNLLMYVIASGGSKMAMYASVFGGVFNICFDYVFIKVFNLGMAGAALASGLGLFLPCLILLIYFFRKNKMLYFVKPVIRLRVIAKAITNGLSEFSTSLMSGLVMFLFNNQMLKYAGENGVAASTIIFYIFGLMSAVYIGYMMGASPLFSYFYGSEDHDKLKKLKSICLTLITYTGILATLISMGGSKMLTAIFISQDNPAFSLAVHGNMLFSIALFITGFNTFASSMFTAFGNGIISAVLAISRTFVFLSIAIILLPQILGLNGLWLSVPVAEGMALVLAIYFIRKYQERYGY